MKYFVVFTTLIIVSNCREFPKDNGGPADLIKQETKDFCVYKKGSWWVYKNNGTSTLDTWKLVSFDQGVVGPDEFGGKEEFINMSITSSNNLNFDIKSYTPTMFAFWTNQSMGEVQPTYFDGSNGNNRIKACGVAYLNSIRHDSMGNIPVVKEFKLFPGQCSLKFPIQTTWKKHVGIIQMIYVNNDTLRLVESNPIQ